MFQVVKTDASFSFFLKYYSLNSQAKFLMKIARTLFSLRAAVRPHITSKFPATVTPATTHTATRKPKWVKRSLHEETPARKIIAPKRRNSKFA